MRVILAFWKTLNIPKYSRMNSVPPDAKVSVMEPIPTNLVDWIPFKDEKKPVVSIKES